MARAQRQIAWLRGINVGANRRISMPDLREMLERVGYADPRTYVQSGNVVVSSDKQPQQLGDELERLIAAELGVEGVKVMVRTRDELADVVRRNPLAKVATDPKLYHVSFLSHEPDAERVRELKALDLAPEQVVFSGREIFFWRPRGMQQSRSARAISEQRLGVAATARNWSTVTAVLSLATSEPSA